MNDSLSAGSPRRPPSNLEAERALLGGLLLDDRRIAEAFDQIPPEAVQATHAAHGDRPARGKARQTGEPLFSSPVNQEIFEAIRDLYHRDRAVDLTTLGEELSRRGRYDAVGGAPYLTSLEEEIVSTLYLADYARIVVAKWRLRSLMRVAESIADDAGRAEGEPEEVVDRAAQRLYELTQTTGSRDFLHAGEVARDVLQEIEARAQRDPGHVEGTLSGFLELDRIMTGFRPNNLIVLAARPGVGKSAFAMNIAKFNAVDHNRPVAIFSLEMSGEELVQRLMCSLARVPMNKVRSNFLSHEDRQKLAHWSGTLEHAPLYIDDSSDLSVIELRSRARKLSARVGGLALIVVDYLQLMRGPDRADNRQQEVSAISRGLKVLARDLGVPVIALSQLSRQSEQRGGKTLEDRMPKLSDLRESGAIEQDADAVIFLNRDFPKKGEEKDKDDRGRHEPILVAARVAKQRNGPLGDFNLLFRGELTEFVNIHPDAYGGGARA